MNQNQEQALAHFLLAYLRQFGLDKSTADDLTMAGLHATRYALAADPTEYNPEYWYAMGQQKADQDIAAEVSPSLSALVEITES